MTIGIICVSDRCSKGLCEDKSGPLIREMLLDYGDNFHYLIVPDEKDEIEKALISLCDDSLCDAVFTTGGTGFAPRDITPEATLAVIEKLVPGIPEIIRAESYKITKNAMLSRAVAGIRGKTLIVNLPGSPKAVKESLEIVIPVLPHAVETLSGKTQSCGGNYGKGGGSAEI